MLHQVNHEWQSDLSSILVQYSPTNMSAIREVLLIDSFHVYIILIHSDFKHQIFKYNYIPPKLTPLALSIIHTHEQAHSFS